MRLADEIKKGLMIYVKSHDYDLVIPNYFVGLYEMDLFVLKKSGVLVEYEIKISRADFFADFEKGYNKNGDKHARLKNKTRECNKFFFVVVDGLVKPEEVPEYAGLIYYNNGRFNLIKNAPTLHKNKYRGNELLHKLTFRLNHIQGKLRYLEYKNRELQKQINPPTKK